MAGLSDSLTVKFPYSSLSLNGYYTYLID